METIIIISLIAVIVLAGTFCVYYFGQYLYELYVEYFTTDPDPDHPETPVRPEIDIWEKIDNIITYPAKVREKIEVAIAKGIRTIRKTFEQKPQPTKDEVLQRIRSRHNPDSVWDTEVELNRRMDGLGVEDTWDTDNSEDSDIWDARPKRK
jgi:hypothetical protein